MQCNRLLHANIYALVFHRILDFKTGQHFYAALLFFMLHHR